MTSCDEVETIGTNVNVYLAACLSITVVTTTSLSGTV